MRDGAIETFRKLCIPNTKFIDIILWNKHKNKILFTGNRVIGIKGFEGRAGIGMGHNPDFSGLKDPDYKLLKEWIGESIKHYGVNS